MQMTKIQLDASDRTESSSAVVFDDPGIKKSGEFRDVVLQAYDA
jgi:hypothetical protein